MTKSASGSRVGAAIKFAAAAAACCALGAAGILSTRKPAPEDSVVFTGEGVCDPRRVMSWSEDSGRKTRFSFPACHPVFWHTTARGVHTEGDAAVFTAAGVCTPVTPEQSGSATRFVISRCTP